MYDALGHCYIVGTLWDDVDEEEIAWVMQIILVMLKSWIQLVMTSCND